MTVDLEWRAAAPCGPPEGEILVWRVSLEPPLEAVAHYRALLSDEERTRADRYVFEHSRKHFTVARGVLRTLLGATLGIRPESVAFQFGAQGKPSLLPGIGDGRLHFNVSHSHELALIAFARDREHGIDVEHIHRVSFEGIVRRNFSEVEQAEFFATPEPLWFDAFFNGWTRKEAFIKATGEGLHHPLGSFDVPLAPDRACGLLATRPDPDEASRWTLVALEPGPAYKGALCYQGDPLPVRCLDWQF